MNNFQRYHLNVWREIAIMMIILMEMSWVTPWFITLTTETSVVRPSIVILILLVLILFSHYLIRLLDYFQLKKSIRQILVVIFLIIGCFITIKMLLYDQQPVSLSVVLNRPLKSFADLRTLIPAEFIIIITSLIVFWRGISLAQEYIGPSSFMSHFWVGILMYICYIFLFTIVTGETPGRFFYLFLFSSLFGLSSARMAVKSLLRGGMDTKFSLSWFLGLFIISSLVTGLAVLLGAVIGDNFNSVRYIALITFGSIVVLLWTIISPIFTLLLNLLYNLLKNFQGFSGIGDTLQKLNNLLNELNQRLSNIVSGSEVGQFFSSMAPTIKAIILIGIIVIVIAGIILWMSIKLWKDRERNRSEEEISSMAKVNLFQLLMEQFRRGWKDALVSMARLMDINHHKRLRVAARIRQIYSEVLDLCESLGQPRPEASTPLEFESKIENIFSEYQQEVRTITQAYLGVRYGFLPETASDIAEVEAAWRRIKSIGEELLQLQKHKKITK